MSDVASAQWLGIGPGAITGFGGAGVDDGSGGIRSALSGAATTNAGPSAPLWSPDNPLFWFAGLLLVVTGFVAVSASAKAGPLKGKVSA